MARINQRFSYIALMSISLFILGCSTESPKGTTALFNNKADAEKAAKSFNCKGAHKMGDKWMPCESHKTHQPNQKHGGHGHKH